MSFLKTHASTKDNVAKLLYGDQGGPRELFLEVELINRVETLWLKLRGQIDNGQMSEAAVEKTLLALDARLKHRLSGAGMLRLMLAAEIKHPQFIRYMPETLASRYEEIQVARIWSSLLNPESLIRLRSSIEFEKNINGDA